MPVKLERDGVVLSWDDEARLLEMHYDPNAAPTHATAKELGVWIKARVGDREPFLVLCDIEHIARATVGWITGISLEARSLRPRMRVACYNAGPTASALLGLFSTVSGAPIPGFGPREEALAWLTAAGEGVPADPAPTPGA